MKIIKERNVIYTRKEDKIQNIKINLYKTDNLIQEITGRRRLRWKNKDNIDHD